MPKTVDKRRHCEDEEEREHATVFRNPIPTSWFLGVVEDCYMLSLLLTVPSRIYSFWDGVIPTSYILHFNTCRQYCVSYYWKLSHVVYTSSDVMGTQTRTLTLLGASKEGPCLCYKVDLFEEVHAIHIILALHPSVGTVR